LFLAHPLVFARSSQTAAQFWAAPDIPFVIRGAGKIHGILDTLRWWHGSWINELFPTYYRPVSSYLYLLDVALFHRFGEWSCTAITVTLWLVCTALAGVLTARITGARWMAYAAIPCCLIYHGAAGHSPDWLLCWLMQDSELCIVFWLASLIAFDIWFEQNSKKSLLWAFAFCALSCFSKEIGYFLPMAWLVMALYRRPYVRGDGRWAMLAFLPAISALAIRVVLNTGKFIAVEAFRAQNFGARVLLADLRTHPASFIGHIGGLILVLAAICVFWELRRPTSVGTAIMLFLVTCLTAPNFVPAGQYCILSLAMASPVLGVLAFKSLEFVRSKANGTTNSLHSKRPADPPSRTKGTTAHQEA